MNENSSEEMGENPWRVCSRLLFIVSAFTGIFLGGLSCSILATRPVQEMSDTSAAIRASKEVQADTLAPELFRLSNEWFFRARREYKFKNFKLAKEYSNKARHYAEKAEFEALRNGGNRTEIAVTDPLGNAAENLPPEGSQTPDPTPYAYPSPTGTPAEVFDQRKAEEEAKKRGQTQGSGTSPIGGAGAPAPR